MSDSVEASARTVAEAIELALLRLNARRNEVAIEVLSEGRGGILGIGAEDARVRVTRLVERSGRGPVESAFGGPLDRPPVERFQREAPPRPAREARPAPPPPAAFDEDVYDEDGEDDDYVEAEDVAEAAPVVARIPRTGSDREIAVAGREVLEELLEHMGIYSDVDILGGDGEPIILNIRGAEQGALIGRRGSTLAALQFMVNLILGKRFQYRAKVTVDVEGYRRKRERALTELALRMADRVRSSGQTVVLEAMPAIERRIVHLALADDPDVATVSTGEGEERKVTIQLRR